MTKPIPHVEVGDTIDVHGRHFVLVGFNEELNKGAYVTFVQPHELVEAKNVVPILQPIY